MAREAMDGPAAVLARALAARLCHDLAGALGTLTGCLDVLAEEATIEDEAFDLARRTAAEAVARVRLFRAAWAGGEEPLSIAAITRLADALPRRHLITLDLDALGNSTLPPAMGAVVLNVLLLAAEALPTGGAITMVRDRAQDWVLTVAGRQAGWPGGLAAALSAPDAVPAGGPVTVAMAVLAAAAAGVRLSLLMAGPGHVPPLLIGRVEAAAG